VKPILVQAQLYLCIDLVPHMFGTLEAYLETYGGEVHLLVVIADWDNCCISRYLWHLKFRRKRTNISYKRWMKEMLVVAGS
jgi:hypothetical protein